MANEKKKVERQLDVDTNRLYGTLSEAIAYLQEVQSANKDKPDLSLTENWTGYEYMDMIFTYSTLETDEEFEFRLQLEEYRRKEVEKAAAREKQRQLDLKELKRLQDKLGFHR